MHGGGGARWLSTRIITALKEHPQSASSGNEDDEDVLNSRKISYVWHDDEYQWGSDVCMFSAMTAELVDTCFASKNIRSVLMMGDSVSLDSMWDVKDLFNDINVQWLREHPMSYTDRTRGMYSNWDGIVAGWMGARSGGREFMWPEVTGMCYTEGAWDNTKCTAKDGTLHTKFFFIQYLHNYIAMANFTTSEDYKKTFMLN
jgi:hypothetical protein